MIVGVKLSEAAKANGVSRQSACRWFHAGVLPVPARQLATGTILVEEPPTGRAGVALYARVPSGDQRADLARFGVEYLETSLAAQAGAWLWSKMPRWPTIWP